VTQARHNTSSGRLCVSDFGAAANLKINHAKQKKKAQISNRDKSIPHRKRHTPHTMTAETKSSNDFIDPRTMQQTL
jgi:hypothetical protein